MMKTQTIRETGQQIMAWIAAHGKQSCRKLGSKLALSKSSVHRHLQARERRDRYPESGFWETEEGAAWLRRVYWGVLYCFGLGNNIGAERLSEFFKVIRIDTHVGSSAAAVGARLRQMEAVLPQFQQACESGQADQRRQVVVAGDETFFGDLLILVLMDLTSGYLLVAEIAEDRKFETWLQAAEPRLKALNLEVDHAVTDRAKALIKLAVEGLGVPLGRTYFMPSMISASGWGHECSGNGNAPKNPAGSRDGTAGPARQRGGRPLAAGFHKGGCEWGQKRLPENGADAGRLPGNSAWRC
jgi:hypothetical protein